MKMNELCKKLIKEETEKSAELFEDDGSGDTESTYDISIKTDEGLEIKRNKINLNAMKFLVENLPSITELGSLEKAKDIVMEEKTIEE